MKLIIDIPEVDYNYVKQQVADGITNPLKIFIASGTPVPDNATNGDMIKAIFPESEVILNEKNTISWMYKGMIKIYPLDWWNAPYQKGDTNEQSAE
ncbi:MAG: hypothetical protein J6S85_16965 [Methanobrevibacter sp.]|nr:hypothetical protein [Methanobrevibacter sp.]